MSKDGGSYNKLKENLPAINTKLAKFFDSDDPIRMGLAYHGLPRSGGKRGSRQRPAWTNSTKTIQKVIRQAFPHFETNNEQRILAARWARVIYLYFLAGHTYGQISEEMGLHSNSKTRPYAIVEGIIERIYRVGNGFNGEGQLRKKRGRRLKIRVVTPASISETKP
jgi:hypothetical protein